LSIRWSASRCVFSPFALPSQPHQPIDCRSFPPSQPTGVNTITMGLSIFRKRHEAEDVTPLPGPLEAAAAAASGTDHLENLKQFEKAHKLDPNLPIDDLTDVDAAIATGNAEKGIEIEHALMEDNSPYPEVCTTPQQFCDRSVAGRIDRDIAHGISHIRKRLDCMSFMKGLID
jgi:hypothetical protein